MRIFIVCLGIIAIAYNASAAPLSSWDQRMFYARNVTACENEVRKTRNGTKAQQDYWCECTTYETIKIITKEDLEPSQATLLNQKVQIAVGVCRNRLLTPSGSFK